MLVFIVSLVVLGSIGSAGYYVKTSPKRWMQIHGNGMYNHQRIFLKKVTK